MGLSAYAMIRMEDGTEKRAEDILAGDRVREALTGAPLAVARSLNQPGVGMISLSLADGAILHLTGDQPVLTERGMLAAGGVRPGTPLRTAAGPVACVEAAPLMGDYMVYDVEVAAGREALPFLSANGVAVAVRARGIP